MKSEINILVSSLGGGGAEKVAINLANNLDKRVSLISLTGVKDYSLDLLNKNVKLIIYNQKKIRYSILEYFNYLIKNKPKYILSIGRDTNLVLGIICPFLNYKPKLIFREESTIERMKDYVPKEKIIYKLLNKFLPFVLRIIISYLYSKSSLIIANSRDTYLDIKHFLLFKKPSVKVIHNPVLPFKFNYEDTKNSTDIWMKDKSLKVILGVGRLCQSKRFDVLLRAFRIVHEEKKNTRLIICGQGIEEENLKKLSNELRISNQVSFKGFCSNPYPYFKSADIFCLSSDYEGFGNVLIEAMAFGTKVVTTNCKGVPRSVLEGNQYVDFAPKNDHKKLAESILKSFYLPSPSPFLRMEAKKYFSDIIAQNYLNEILRA